MQKTVPSHHFRHLHEKWSKRRHSVIRRLWDEHKHAFQWLTDNAKHLGVSTLGSLLLFTSSGSMLQLPNLIADAAVKPQEIDKSVFLITDLGSILPKEMRPLTDEEEKEAGGVLTRNFGFKVTAELDGKKLNRSYGLIGAEQHLMRYPGDTMESHFDNAEDAVRFTSSGMAPGRGAWGYFAPSQAAMTEKDAMREKYYIAVQTFLIPDYNQRAAEYRDFFKFRKMLVVNPENGKAVVAVIGDSGPAAFTGKHLGGSPEVMKYLERVDGAQRGPVLYFFIDDPNDTIPLGPVEPTV